MSVRVKFTVVSITRTKHWDKSKGDLYTTKLTPVSATNPENSTFYAATPGGEIVLSTVNEAVGRELELGAEVYVDFTVVPSPEGATGTSAQVVG